MEELKGALGMFEGRTILRDRSEGVTFERRPRAVDNMLVMMSVFELRWFV